MGRESDVGFLIKLIYDAHGKVLYQRFRSEGITPAQAEVLRFVMAQGGARTTLRDVEAFLGVSHPTVVGLVSRLVEKGLVCEAGRLDSPGKPILFGTTTEFLRYFGFRDTTELPALKEPEMDGQISFFE